MKKLQHPSYEHIRSTVKFTAMYIELHNVERKIIIIIIIGDKCTLLAFT